MKRKTIVLLPLLLILAGCQRGKNSGEPSLTNPPSSGTSEILKPSASEELPSLTEAPTYRFSQEVDALLEESLGEFIAELPVCTGTSYSVRMSIFQSTILLPLPSIVTPIMIQTT